MLIATWQDLFGTSMIGICAAPPPPSAAAAAVFFLLFSTKGPFQGHTLPLQGNIVYFLHILLILDVFHQFQVPCYYFLVSRCFSYIFYSKFFYFNFINFSSYHFN
jgi:hypothetical protein